MDQARPANGRLLKVQLLQPGEPSQLGQAGCRSRRCRRARGIRVGRAGPRGPSERHRQAFPREPTDKAIGSPTKSGPEVRDQPLPPRRNRSRRQRRSISPFPVVHDAAANPFDLSHVMALDQSLSCHECDPAQPESRDQDKSHQHSHAESQPVPPGFRRRLLKHLAYLEFSFIALYRLWRLSAQAYIPGTRAGIVEAPFSSTAWDRKRRARLAGLGRSSR